tara:strand:+ start:1801 stop:1989 length:189 start_codon:yes stop_codon:yes gene_type:complete
MEFDVVFKFAMGAIISLVIASFASMTKDVTANRVRIDNLDNSVKRTERMVNDIHSYLLRRKP